MIKKILVILIGLAYISFRVTWPLHYQQEGPKPVKQEKKAAAKTVSIKKDVVEIIREKVEPKEVKQTKESNKSPIKEAKEPETVPKKFNASNSSNLKKISFEQLPGWDEAEVRKSLLAFQNSCTTFLKQKPSKQVGSSQIDLQAGDWQPACEAALAMDSVSEEEARDFFEKWFSPINFEQKSKTQGLFTGYYMPQLKGSLTRTAEFTTPIYGMPKNRSFSKAYTREQIDKGALKDKAPVLVWIKSPVDRVFLEIEGAGVIKLNNGAKLYLSYAGENGAHYTSIGSILINKGVMNRNNASKTAIKRYLETHPNQVNSILHQNKSFVFFDSMDKPIGLGVKDVALTPGYSLAVDHKYIPFGAPLWLTTNKPKTPKDSNIQKFQRLMIAQDTGGAIRGLMRGDIYWGSGKTASFLGENMRNKGRYWLLVPKLALNRLSDKFGAKA